MLKYLFFIIVVVLLFPACTKLQEDFKGDLTEHDVAGDAGPLLASVYSSMQRIFTTQIIMLPLEEFSTDEMIAPVRGNDWSDNNLWRVFHEQNWTSYNQRLKECFNSLNGISYAATDVLKYNPKPQQKAEARFVRAWVMYLLLDMFNQVPHRLPGESLIDGAHVWTGLQALDTIVNEIKEALPNLPDAPIDKANKSAAKFLLMKCFLNKAVYAKRNEPSFLKEDMDKVISLANEIIEEDAFKLSKNYFDNFCPNNESLGKENIFTIKNESGDANNFMGYAWGMTLHYDQYSYRMFISGSNGFATLSEFYDKFESNDIRRGTVYSFNGSISNIGKHVNVGLLEGQQYNLDNNSNPFDTVTTKNSKPYIPLNYTREVHNVERGPGLAVTGIRGLKYYPDFDNYWYPDNDFVFFRFTDVLLMKAEAMLRGGTSSREENYGNTALDIVNAIRTHPSRNASKLNNLSLNDLLDERGREFWWEGWRRQDMIRFQKFLNPFQEKEYESDPKYLIYPIPAEQLSVNPNLVQNKGY